MAPSSSLEAPQRKGCAALKVLYLVITILPTFATAERTDPGEALDAHNQKRRLHGVPDLVWDDDLAAYAESWVSQCVYEHSHGPYGENLYFFGGGIPSIYDGVNDWYSEISEYDFNNPGSIYDHFSQVVWKSSVRVGCAYVTNCPGGFNYMLACEYDPAGNVIGQAQDNVFPPGGEVKESSAITSSASNSTLVPAPNCKSFFTVRQGDICYNIWRSYGLSEAQFRALNPGIDCYNLQIGQIVCVGGAAAGELKVPMLQYSGDGTWYDDVGYTSCGEYVYGDGDYAAISWPQSDDLDPTCQGNPNNCNWCNRRAVVSGPAGSARVRLLDKCQACKYGDIDMTKTIFQQVVGDLGIGRAPVTWQIESAEVENRTVTLEVA